MLRTLRDWWLSLLGRNVLPAPAQSNQIFAITTAYIEMQARLNAQPTGYAALAFQQVQSSYFGELEEEIQALTRQDAMQGVVQVETHKDSYNYLWLILRATEFESLVATMHLASSTLEEHDFGRALLAAAFEFELDGQKVYWLYNFKRGKFYPFVPAPHTRERNNALELRLKSLLSTELPIEPDPARWFPLWNMLGTSDR